MGAPRNPEPAKLFVGMISAYPALLDEAVSLLAASFGPVDLAGPDIPFTFTEYYAPSMGAVLFRRFISFSGCFDPARLAEAKLLTNDLEVSFAQRRAFPVPRPINLDPGLLTASKVILATTKDNSHRIYLRQGIYAEITLHYNKGRYQPWEWTYPDYRSEEYQQFFLAVRKGLPRQVSM